MSQVTNEEVIYNNLNMIHLALIRLYAFDNDTERLIEYMKINDRIASLMKEFEK